MEKLLDIKNSTKEELLNEYENCMNDWGKYSCDSFGYYIQALHREIVDRGGWSNKILSKVGI
ncbi:hypothetical protein [Roseivirga spongicola]|uniref:Uncharacterized protein n=1 Tax=Roseivirga spongicola TaxID=333140 RepID=A0A150X9G3_9BACT|nr:hypothetical protein [Roseivirga spongicola]KYG75343.1 hypothetical protein AWW68_11140 [Roseivirga spongicola]WPZ08715.1 hypothetical protein T7867_10645 [Roseivirga spongicola]